MEKEKYIKWRGKYQTKSKPIDFTLNMKELKDSKIGLERKGVKFATLTKEEYNIFDSWTKKERLQFLEDYWNYYMSMMD